MATHLYELPGSYNVRLTVTDQAGQTTTLTRDVVVTGPTLRLAASYVPQLGQARQTSYSTNDQPPFFDFYYDPNLGKFEELPGKPCNQGRPENPTYLKLWVETDQAVSSCTYQGSWDPTSYPCNATILAAINAGIPVVINTNDFETDANTCEDDWPLVPHVPFNGVSWFRLEMVIGGVTHTRRARFRQRAETIHLVEDPAITGDEMHDTYVDYSAPSINFGNNTEIQAFHHSSQPRFGLLNFEVPALPAGATFGSAQLQLKVATGTTSEVNLHRLCGSGSWTETQLTANNWMALTGGSCGAFLTVSGPSSGDFKRYDVSSEVTPGTAVDIGLQNATPATSALELRSAEWSIVSQRPKLVITYQR